MTGEWLADRVLVQIKGEIKGVMVRASCKQRRRELRVKEERGRERRRDKMKKKARAETCKRKRRVGARKVQEALAELRCERLLGTFRVMKASYKPRQKKLNARKSNPSTLPRCRASGPQT